MESSVALGPNQALFTWSDAIEPGNGFDILGRTIPLSTITSVETKQAIPSSIQLSQNYPNPFNPETTIKFNISNSGFVKLKVYNILGELVKTLLDEEMSPGEYSIVWDGKNGRGHAASSGIYIYKLQAGTFTVSQKMVLLR